MISVKSISSLTGLRFVAALLVFVSHYPKPIFPVGEQGYAGVTLFFVLSGFIICINYFEKFEKNLSSSLSLFIVARFARIYPLYCLSILFEWFARGMVSNPIPHLLLLQSWFGNTGVSMGINGPAWSVSVEAFLYFTFPFLFLTAGYLKLPVSNAKLLFSGAFIATIMFALALYFSLSGKSHLPWSDLSSAHRWLYRNPATRIFDFALGVLAGIWFLKHWPKMVNRPNLWWFSTYLSLAIIAALLLWPAHWFSAFSFDISIAVPGLFLIVGLAANQNTLVSRLLSRPLSVLLGELSFAFYLFHVPLRGLYKTGGSASPMNELINYFFFLFIVIITAYGLHKLIEAPARSYLMKAFMRWSTKRDGKFQASNSSESL
jgi:peptidoglycan/LPS O-acetylase OafA/YrhL